MSQATYEDLLQYLTAHPERLTEPITVFNDADGSFNFCEYLEMEVGEVSDDRLVIFLTR
jgi:hypothetical protein